MTIVIIIPMLSLYVEYRYHRLSWCLVNTSKSQIERCGSTGTCTKYTLSLSRGRVMVKQVKSIYPFIVTIVHQHHKRTVGCSIHICGWVHRCCSCCGCCGRWNLLWKLRILFVNKNYTNICRIVHKISFSPVEFVGTGTNRPTTSTRRGGTVDYIQSTIHTPYT